MEKKPFKVSIQNVKRTMTLQLITCCECYGAFWWTGMSPNWCPLCGIPYGDQKPLPKPEPLKPETPEQLEKRYIAAYAAMKIRRDENADNQKQSLFPSRSEPITRKAKRRTSKPAKRVRPKGK